MELYSKTMDISIGFFTELMGYGLGVARFYDPDYGYTWTHTGGTLGYHTLFICLESL